MDAATPTSGGMDAFAVGLEVAQRIIDDGKLAAFVKERYSSFNAGNGKKFEKGNLKLDELAALAKVNIPVQTCH
jgi:xylose isomerase